MSAGTYLTRYAQENPWREDHRRDANGTQVRLAVALAAKPSVDFLRILAAGGAVSVQ